MALIKNTGSYQVKIGIADKQKNPGDSWTEHRMDPATKDIINIDPDMGSGTKLINENDCRYINAKHVGHNSFVHAIADDDHVLTSSAIGAHSFWVFDGMNFQEREDLSQKDCESCHGS